MLPLDQLIFGSRSLKIGTPLSLEEARNRLILASDSEPSDNETLYLRVIVKDRHIVAGYSCRFDPGRHSGPPFWMQLFQTFRPAFSGVLPNHQGELELSGRYGLNNPGNLASVAAMCAVVLLFLGRWFALGSIASICWVALALFAISIVLTRLNSDDIPYIEKNLHYALRPEG